jgi:hypothetical protein
MLAITCFLPASALTPSAPENPIWEIFSIGYDAPTTEVTDIVSRAETSTSNYDTAPIHSATAEAKPTQANRALFGQIAEFKAAEEGVTVYRGVSSVTQGGEANPAFQDALQGVANPRGSILDPVAHNASNEGSAASGFTSWTNGSTKRAWCQPFL